MKKAALLLLSIGVLFGTAVRSARGQSALDGFDPNANGLVRVVVVQPDGKILIGGDFTTLSPNGGAAVTRNRIARLNPDGTLDLDFNPNANAPVRAIALQADGKILVGGNLTMIGGQTRGTIARLDPTTGAPDAFNPTPDGFVHSIVVQRDGKILVGGDFLTIGGQTRQRIARLDPASGLADAFDPNAQDVVYAIAVQADGKILAGGDFFSIGGQSRARMARLNAATGLADSFDPNANDTVRSIALQADGRILAGGRFTNIGSQSRGGFARLHPTSGAADSLNLVSPGEVFSISVRPDGNILAGGTFVTGAAPFPSIALIDSVTGSRTFRGTGVVHATAVQADGKLLVGGTFSGANSIGGQTRNRIARLETDGRLDQTLDAGIVGTVVYTTAVQPDGKILIGGSFTNVLGQTRNNIARLNTDGTLDTGFNPNANNAVYAFAVQPDGTILVGGAFFGANSIGGQTRNYIARLDASTGLAESFDPNANGLVVSMVAQADGKILAGGAFTNIGGQPRNRIARIDGTTGAADSFNPNANNNVSTIAVQTDGKILVGGQFSGTNSIGGQSRNRIARLDATTGLADAFDPNANGDVRTIALRPDGQIYAGGLFTMIQGRTRNYIVELSADGVVTGFNVNPENIVSSIVVQQFLKLLFGGAFTRLTIDAGPVLTRNAIARLDRNSIFSGSLDPFNPSLTGGSFPRVNSIAEQTDSKLLVGGVFTTAGGQPRNLFVRLSSDTATLQNLAVTQTAITWTRRGSSPHLTRATFEYSSDSVNYTPLGNGTAAPFGDWSLTGLSLPTGVNFYIRARGYYRGGYGNGSESITESVRNVFLRGDQPVVGNISKNGDEDTQIAFSAANFDAGFSDPNGDVLAIVRVTSLPANGTLKLSGSNVAVNQDIPRASLGNLTFDPALDFNSSTNFGWNGSDGTLLATNAALVNITVNAVNDNPVAGVDTIFRYPSQSTKVRISTLVSNDSDVDGGTIAFVSVPATSTGGQALTTSGGYVFYNPAAGFPTADSFPYTINDGQGGTATGTVNVQIIADNGQSQNTTRIRSEPAPGGGIQARVSFAGIPGRAYRVQSTDSLSPPAWVTRMTVPANAQGAFEFVDPPPLPPTRFYRSVFP